MSSSPRWKVVKTPLEDQIEERWYIKTESTIIKPLAKDMLLVCSIGLNIGLLVGILLW